MPGAFLMSSALGLDVRLQQAARWRCSRSDRRPRRTAHASPRSSPSNSRVPGSDRPPSLRIDLAENRTRGAQPAVPPAQPFLNLRRSGGSSSESLSTLAHYRRKPESSVPPKYGRSQRGSHACPRAQGWGPLCEPHRPSPASLRLANCSRGGLPDQANYSRRGEPETTAPGKAC